MRIGAIADIHSNKPALAAVMDDMPDVNRIVCAGDVVGYNPWPAACVDVVREQSIPTVMGNHDRAAATGTAFRFNAMARAGIEHTRERLDDDQLDWLRQLPDERSLLDGEVTIVHGHPDDPDRYTYPADFTADMLGDERVLLLGHTHVQHAEQYDEGIICNPGSVGQPRDGNPQAGYAVIDLGAETVELHRVPYDIDQVVAAVERAELPERIGSRLREGR